MGIPDITVLMPAYNAEAYISEAITSILRQTYASFELVIVNDASTDDTLSRIESFTDPRIRVIQNKTQLGLADTRQKGIVAARGKYIAFLDADDIARPDRLEKQRAYLEKQTEIDVVGSWVAVMDKQGRTLPQVWKHPVSTTLIPIILLFRNCLTQSAVMLRKACLPDISFRSAYWAAPDYDLWIRLLPTSRFATIPETLVSYRVFQDSMSFQKVTEIEQCTRKITKFGLQEFGIVASEEEITLQELFERCDRNFSDTMLRSALAWCEKLILHNKKIQRYPDADFQSVLRNYWFKLCCAKADGGSATWKTYQRASFVGSGNGRYIRSALLRIFTLLRKNKIIDITSQDWLSWNT